MLEERGFATVALGLVRYQMENVRPPRGLWTPFQLGRPLGEPENPAFQRRVLMRALGLLERTDGPVILDDFPDDPPGWLDQPGWQQPFVSQGPRATDPAAVGRQLAAELARLRPFWDAAQRRYGRTTVSGCLGRGRRPGRASSQRCWRAASPLCRRTRRWPFRYAIYATTSGRCTPKPPSPPARRRPAGRSTIGSGDPRSPGRP